MILEFRRRRNNWADNKQINNFVLCVEPTLSFFSLLYNCLKHINTAGSNHMCPLVNFLDAVLVYPINRQNIFIFRGFFYRHVFCASWEAWLCIYDLFVEEFKRYIIPYPYPTPPRISACVILCPEPKITASQINLCDT